MNKKKSLHVKKAAPTSGFSVIEILVAFGLIAIVAAGIASLTTSGMKQQKGLQAKDQQREVTAEIRNLLNSKVACLNSFSGNPSGSGFTPTTIRDSSAAPGAAMYTVNTNDKTGLLRFDEFRVSNFVVDPTNANLGTAELQIKLSKVGDTGTVKDVKPDIIMLKVMRNVAGNITECFTIGGNNEALWQVGTNLSNIYYNGGNVGIGTATPQNMFSVDSTGGGLGFISVIKPTASIDADIISPFNGSSNLQSGSFQYGTQPATASWVITKRQTGDPAWINLVTVRNNGNVGIGTTTPTTKLEVAGEIKLGNTSSACNATNEGQMRYNATLKNMQFCNGTTWSVVGGSSFNPLSCTTTSAFAMGWACACPAGKFITNFFLIGMGPGNSCTVTCCG